MDEEEILPQLTGGLAMARNGKLYASRGLYVVGELCGSLDLTGNVQDFT